MSDPRPIGVFDSGVGGLTVVRSIIDQLPNESIVYFGDSARYPYGPRSLEEIRGFAREIASLLLDRDVKQLVVACNSVEVAAIEDLAANVAVPVLGVIEPGVRAALRATRTGRVGVIGTEATIASGEYDRAVAATGASVELHAAACPEFVPHVEAGDTTSDELRALAEAYLAPLRAAERGRPDPGVHALPAARRASAGGDGPGRSARVQRGGDGEGRVRGAASGPAGWPRARPSTSSCARATPRPFRALGARFLGPEVSEVRSTVLSATARHPWS